MRMPAVAPRDAQQAGVMHRPPADGVVALDDPPQ
jgi:hypothetical protein